jgi:glycerate-2-kinase
VSDDDVRSPPEPGGPDPRADERATHVDVILRAAIAAADPASAVRHALASVPAIGTAHRVFVLAIGKAASAMAQAALAGLPRPHSAAIVIVPHGMQLDDLDRASSPTFAAVWPRRSSKSAQPRRR